jgi:hypothetical protein
LSFVLILAVGVGFVGSCSDTTAPKSDSGAWVEMESGTTENLRGVWGFDTGEAFAVGDNGTILFYDGSRWVPMESGTTSDLVGVWGGSLAQVVVTGDNGTILLYDGSSWSPMESGTTEPIGAVWGYPACLEGPPPPCPPYSFFAYAVGGGPPGTVLRWRAGGVWETVATGTSQELTDITGWSYYQYWPISWEHGIGLMAVGKNGAACVALSAPLGEEEWVVTETGIAEDLTGIAGETSGNVYAISANGSVIQNTNQFVDTGPPTAWRPVAQLAGSLSDAVVRDYNDFIFVGANGSAVQFDRETFDEMATGTAAALNDVWSGADVLYAVGDGGTILRYDESPKTKICPFDVKLTATNSTTPMISWTPSCAVSKIVVEDEYGGVQWFVAADGNLIEPDVEYGTTPAGSAVLRPTGMPLIANELYRVTLIRRDWDRERKIGTWNLLPQEDGTADSLTLAPAPSSAAYEEGIFFFQGLRALYPDQQVYEFSTLVAVRSGVWRVFGDPVTREQNLGVRPVAVEVLERDPETGQFILVMHRDLRAADLPPFSGGNPVTVVWDHIHVERR